MRWALLMCAGTAGCLPVGRNTSLLDATPPDALGAAGPERVVDALGSEQGVRQQTISEPREEAENVEAESSLVRGRGRNPARDYAIRVGMGFSPAEILVLEEAVESWVEATGLPLHLRHGYGPLGNFHITETIPVCGQRWVYDGYLGCYSPAFDSVVLNRPGLEREGARELLFIVLVHELGHFLGLGHAEENEDSVMLPDYPTLAGRSGALSSLSQRDIQEACLLNPCQSRTFSK